MFASISGAFTEQSGAAGLQETAARPESALIGRYYCGFFFFTVIPRIRAPVRK